LTLSVGDLRPQGAASRLRDMLPPEAVQVVMGIMASYIMLARNANPPKHLSGKEALQQYGQALERAARAEFGDEEWNCFQRALAASGAPFMGVQG
jgi:hypothetical protein